MHMTDRPRAVDSSWSTARRVGGRQHSRADERRAAHMRSSASSIGLTPVSGESPRRALDATLDPALTAKLLHLANSAYYGFARRISTVRDAVVLLGFRAVRSAALASSIIDALPGSTLVEPTQLWRFSVTVGMVAEVLARAHGR